LNQHYESISQETNLIFTTAATTWIIIDLTSIPTIANGTVAAEAVDFIITDPAV
jgi:hypothetical protein